MAGFVQELTARQEAVDHAVSSLAVPWRIESEPISTALAGGRRLADDVLCPEVLPPFDRSTRDGYAIVSGDCYGASTSNPAFMAISGEVPMGVVPGFSVRPGECAAIHTGGILPAGADAVVMAENAERAGKWVEVRKPVQRGENIVFKGEEFSAGSILLDRGAMIDFRTVGILSNAGVSSVRVINLKVGVISSGDEIVPCETEELLPGQFRDVNSSILSRLLSSHGYEPRCYGIAADSYDSLEGLFRRALEECNVVLISGGSSVSSRDHTSELLESLTDPGLLVRGILMSPGKPTLIAGLKRQQRLVIGLPGHPFSCFLAAYNVALPLIHSIHTGIPVAPWRTAFLQAAEPVFGHTGIEEFTPFFLREGRVAPLPTKSSFVKTLAKADGLIRLPVSRETARAGEEVEAWLW